MKPLIARYALGAAVLVALLTACGRPQPPIAPGAMPQSPAIAGQSGHPVAHPTTLNFYSAHPLKFTVRQRGYYGRFIMSDSDCRYIASVKPKSATGPRARFKVTPIQTPSGGHCVVTVADVQGHTAKVTVNNPGY